MMASVVAARSAAEALASRSSTNARGRGIASQGWCAAKGNAGRLRWVTPARGIRSVVLRCTAQNLALNAPNSPVINAGPGWAALRVRIAKRSMMRPDWAFAAEALATLLVKKTLRIALEMPALSAQPTVTARAMSDARIIAAKHPLQPVSAIRTALAPCRFVLKADALNAAPTAIATRAKRAPTINVLVEIKDAPQTKNVLKISAVATGSASRSNKAVALMMESVLTTRPAKTVSVFREDSKDS